MKKNILKIALATSLALTGTTSLMATEVSNSDIVKIKKDFPALLGRQGVSIIKSQDLGKVKQLQVRIQTPRGPQEFETFIVEGLDVIFAGTAFDKKGVKVSFPVNADVIKDGVAFKIGNGPKQLYLVTDPECPYCKRLEQNIDEDKLKDYTVNLITMPLGFHKNAKDMYRYILSGKTDVEKTSRYKEVMNGSDVWSKVKLTEAEISAANKIMEKGQAAAKELGARGTPSIFDANFDKFNYGPLMKSK